MNKRFFTIGMAGHIDHGKTSLTKALTNIDTDRLKEEKERQISIELGFAPLYEDDDIQISVVDVPGHERFIRQMIAGVAGIDLVVLVIAADEGIMPQTREHLEILQFLGIEKGIVVITKIDRVDDELKEFVQEEIAEELQHTVFAEAPIVSVDSLSHSGIEELKTMIIEFLKNAPKRETSGSFRLPIDQVFTVIGQGTVVRGTVYDGVVTTGQMLTVLPEQKAVRARQLQVHHHSVNQAFAGQRVAINLSGIAKDEIKRGDVLVSNDHFIVTNTIDVSLRTSKNLRNGIKQRMPIKCHIGTAEVMGKIVFFDRNEHTEGEKEILCQLRLNEEIVTKRGDHFILRRPTPQETIGGGTVIDPRGKKHRFGEKTILELEQKKQGSPFERVVDVLIEAKSLTIQEIIRRTSLEEMSVIKELEKPTFIKCSNNIYTLKTTVDFIQTAILEQLVQFHEQEPFKQGINKAELLHSLQITYPKVVLDFVIEQETTNGSIKRKDQFISTANFEPHIPKQWQKRSEQLLQELKNDGLTVRFLSDYFNRAGIPDSLMQDFEAFYRGQGLIIKVEGQFYWHEEPFNQAIVKLKNETKVEFDVSEAKQILGLSRKFIIPFLEKLDELKWTKRSENKRLWCK